MARQLAMSRRERLRVRFDLANRALVLEHVEAGSVLDVYRYGEKGVELGELSAGPEIMFHPSGRSATATTITIYDREGRRTVLTVSLTGRVSLS
jgi:type IV fimbrial biogenesis protein FimT